MDFIYSKTKYYLHKKKCNSRKAKTEKRFPEKITRWPVRINLAVVEIKNQFLYKCESFEGKLYDKLRKALKRIWIKSFIGAQNSSSRFP